MNRVWTHAIASIAVCVVVACSGDSPTFDDAGAGLGGASGNAGIGGVGGFGGAGSGGTGNTATCGDRRIEAGELCDDGNTLDDDYCRADCQANTGFCGDGILQAGLEGCDTGFSNSLGCETCAVSPGTRCEGEPSVCGPSTLVWDKPLDFYTRDNAETYCTWLIGATFGNLTSISCPGGITLTRRTVSDCADQIESFADGCVAPIPQLLACSSGLSVCELNTAGPANTAAGQCNARACARICESNTWSCNGNTARHCNQWGNGYEETDCGVGTCSTAFQGSNDPNEVCGLTICESNTWSCLGNTARLCATDRLSYAQEVDCSTSSCVSGGRISTPMNQVCDVNECLSGTHNCNANATCTNVPGSFMCMCNSGYSGDGITCTDIDECTSNTDNCDTNATCANTVGSFMCMCNGDYNGSGTTCLRDECALNLHNCDVNAHCIDTAQSFTCACNGGYAGNGVTCSDINECTGNHTCDTSPSACINDIGSHHCVCPDGYAGNGVGSSGCLDINECMTGDYTCDPNAGCINTAGSYGCACNSGYSGDGITCTPYATLTSLVPSYGTLVPTFNPQVTSYTLTLPLSVSTLSFTVASSSASSILIDSQAVSSGTASSPRVPAIGSSTTTVAISGSGVLDRSYTVSVTRAPYTYFKPRYSTSGGPEFGTSVAISGNTLVVGAPRTTSQHNGASGAGAVYFYERTANGWSLSASFRDAPDQRSIGQAVAIDGDIAAVGQLSRTIVYVRSGNTWVQDTVFEGGGSFAISSNTIALGRHLDASAATGINGDETDTSAPSAGAVHVLTRSNGTWTRQAYIKASNTDASDYFGSAVALHDNTLVACAPNEGSTATGVNGDQSINSYSPLGACYVFVRTGTTWIQQAYIKSMAAGSYRSFGQVVALWGDRFATATAPFSAGTTTNVYVYERTGNTWAGVSIPHPFATGYATGAYGYSLALRNDYLLIGHPAESGSSALIDGVVNQNSSGAGAALMFRRGTSGWEYIHYIKASNPGESDAFGTSVAIDSWIAVGARRENSSATTINGDQLNNGAIDSGAVYVF